MNLKKDFVLDLELKKKWVEKPNIDIKQNNKWKTIL